jgi:hypothetical protein
MAALRRRRAFTRERELTDIDEGGLLPCAGEAPVPIHQQEIPMRILALAMLAIGALSTAAPARAQAYDPNFPVCLRIYGPIGYNECNYTSLAQCNASASGRSAQCIVNPFFANARAPVGRSYRHRPAY